MEPERFRFSIGSYTWLRWLVLLAVLAWDWSSGAPTRPLWLLAGAALYLVASNEALRRVPGRFAFYLLWTVDMGALGWALYALAGSPLYLLLYLMVAAASIRGSWSGAVYATTVGALAFLAAIPFSRETGWISLALFPMFGWMSRMVLPEPVPVESPPVPEPGSQRVEIDREQQLADALKTSRDLARAKEQRDRDLTDKQRRLASLMQISRAMSTLRDRDELLRYIATKAREEMNSGASFVMLLGRSVEDNGVLTFRPSIPSLYEDTQDPILYVAVALNVSDITCRIMNCRPGQGIFGHVVSSGQTVRLGEGDDDPRWGPMQTSLECFKTLLCVPLQSQWDKSPFGVLGVGNVLVGDAFIPEHEDFLKMLACDAALAIKNIVFFRQLKESYNEIIMALAQAIEAKDPYTSGHVDRVRDYAIRLARALDMTEEEVRIVEQGAVLHDVGKIATPDAVLLKPGPLSPEERLIMDKHVEETHRILSEIAALPRQVVEIAAMHHERHDGKGYPRQLKGDQIPIGAQVISVVDAFDAMTTDRPYRKGFSTEEALKRLAKGSGTQFNPVVMKAFVEMFQAAPERPAVVEPPLKRIDLVKEDRTPA